MKASVRPSSFVPRHSKVGLWLVGARGGIGTVLAVGLAALQRKLTAPVGLLTEAPDWASPAWAPWDRIVVGGHEVRRGTLWESAQELKIKSRIFSDGMLAKVKGDLKREDGRVRPGLAQVNRAGIQRVIKELEVFRRAEGLSDVVVVNIASTESAVRGRGPASVPELERTLSRGGSGAPLSAAYAYAAMQAGCHYVNFTPSTGSAWPAFGELAAARRLLHMGRDGKTGETLVKTALAPMFRARNFRVNSWAGYNMLGDRDGETLQGTAQKASKIATKSGVLGQLLGYDPHAIVQIDYVPSLHEWKTAWDFIHFQGFLETPMAMQFTWQGCDAVLAAPLVLDLLRLTARASAQGESGLMPWLACFFKAPQGVKEHGLDKQVEMLKAHVADWGSL